MYLLHAYLCKLLESAAGVVGGGDNYLGILHTSPCILVISVTQCTEVYKENR